MASSWFFILVEREQLSLNINATKDSVMKTKGCDMYKERYHFAHGLEYSVFSVRGGLNFFKNATLGSSNIFLSDIRNIITVLLNCNFTVSISLKMYSFKVDVHLAEY